MKVLIAAAALTVAGTANAQIQTNCYAAAAGQVVCRSYNTGAPQIPGSSSETVNYGGRNDDGAQLRATGLSRPPE